MIESEYLKLREQGRIYFGKDGNGTPRVIRYLSEVEGIVPWTWWPHEEVGHTDEARKEIQSIFGTQTAFDTPKPVRLIERILQIVTKSSDLILDFFAGSGTIAHAVLKLNREDGGNRRFILVSNTEATADAPDKNLCRDVCAERVRRVINGYRNKKNEWVEGLGGDLLKTRGASFAYLRARRIPAEMILSRIEHEQIWTALQLIHTETLTPFDATVLVQQAETENGVMLYVSKVSETVIGILEQAIYGAGTAIIYSWQPGWLNQHIEDERASFQPIPQFLVNRFGLGART
jgi:adenine-specific DNA-methyltransferase